MNCIFDNCELWNGILLGILSAALFSIFSFVLRRKWYKWKYRIFTGTYDGYAHPYHENTRAMPQSVAVITHNRDNILTIVLSHMGDVDGVQVECTWIGELTITSDKAGIIAWRYILPVEKQQEFGFKRLIIQDAAVQKNLFLISDQDIGYGREVLIKKQSK